MTDVQKCFELTCTVAGTNHVVYADKQLSSMNNRLYRQGMDYYVKLTIPHNYAGNDIKVFALTHSFKLRTGYRRMKKAWLESIKEELKIAKANGRMAKWFDFRVGNDLQAYGELKPLVYNGGLTQAIHDPFVGTSNAEYIYSSARDDAGNLYNFSVGDTSVSASGGTYGAIDEYDKATNQPVDGNLPTETPYEFLHTEIQDQALDDLTFDGDVPPYDKDDVGRSGVWQLIATLGVNPNGASKLTTGFFRAPLGMIATNGYVGSNINGDADLCLHYQDGNYKGVKAEPFAAVGGF